MPFPVQKYTVYVLALHTVLQQHTPHRKTYGNTRHSEMFITIEFLLFAQFMAFRSRSYCSNTQRLKQRMMGDCSPYAASDPIQLPLPHSCTVPGEHLTTRGTSSNLITHKKQQSQSSRYLLNLSFSFGFAVIFYY